VEELSKALLSGFTARLQAVEARTRRSSEQICLW